MQTLKEREKLLSFDGYNRKGDILNFFKSIVICEKQKHALMNPEQAQ